MRKQKTNELLLSGIIHSLPLRAHLVDLLHVALCLIKALSGGGALPQSTLNMRRASERSIIFSQEITLRKHVTVAVDIRLSILHLESLFVHR